MAVYDYVTADQTPGPVSFADLVDADLWLVYHDGKVRNIRHDELMAALRDNANSPDIVEIDGDTTLDSSHRNKTLYVTANAVLTLPVYADVDPEFALEIIKGVSTLDVSLATQGSDTIRENTTVVEYDTGILRTPVAGKWAGIGGVSAP